MNTRRIPRSHLRNEVADDNEEQLPSVRPDLIEHLDKAFPVRLSPMFPLLSDIAQDQARLTGQQEVIDYLRKLSAIRQS